MYNSATIPSSLITRETEKALGISVQMADEYDDDLCVKLMWLPKSVVTRTESEVIVPLWLFNRKANELEPNYRIGIAPSFKSQVTFN